MFFFINVYFAKNTTQIDPARIIKLGCKLHVDAVGNHPKVFFVSLTLFSIDRLFVFAGHYRLGEPLPKFVAVGSDTKARAYVRNALRELVDMSKTLFQVSNKGHCVQISTDPVLLSGDGNVKPMFTGGPFATDQACAVYEVFHQI